jgi:hypothetical protein
VADRPTLPCTIPDQVVFTGLTVVNTRLLMSGRKLSNGVIPSNWTRVTFDTGERYPMMGVDQWIGRNLVNRWSCGCFTQRKGDASTVTTVMLAFEDEQDAVMFRLMEGETAWVKEMQA